MITALLGGQVLLPDGSIEATDLVIGPNGIEGVGRRVGRGRPIDLRGYLVLPGIVDLHGDAFERQLMPRPRVHFDHMIALRDTDRQLVANGITTAFHALTYSWEPGLRGREAAEALLLAQSKLAGSLACDTRLHLRHETYNVDAVDQIIGWIEDGRVGLLAFNNHVGDIEEKCRHDVELAQYADRSGLSPHGFRELFERVKARADEVADATTRLAAAARAAGVAMASHDDDSPGTRAHYNDLGAALCEFPLDAATAAEARRLGSAIIMGAPNIVRGGSHAKRFSAHQAWRSGLCSVLASDYYYPALAIAAFRLVREGDASLGDAWRAISAAPADAAGLRDRGLIREGMRADLILVDLEQRDAPRIVGTFANGKLAYLAELSLALAGVSPLAFA